MNAKEIHPDAAVEMEANGNGLVEPRTGTGQDGVASKLAPTEDFQQGHGRQTPPAQSSHHQLKGASGSVPESLAMMLGTQPGQLGESETPREIHPHPHLHPQAAGPSSQGMPSAGGTPGADVSAGEVANGAADSLPAPLDEHEMRRTPAHIYLGMPQDNSRTKQLDDLRLSHFDKYRRFAQRWIQRKNEKKQQQQQQQQQHTLKPTATLGAHQGFGSQGMQQLQNGTDIPFPQGQFYAQPQPQPAGGAPLNMKPQAAHPPQGGVMSAGQRQEQAFALAQGLQLPSVAVPIARHLPAPAAQGDAIDLTDDIAAAAAATAGPPAASYVEPTANAQAPNDQTRDWQAYQAYTQSQQQYQQLYQQLHQQQLQQQQLQLQQQQPRVLKNRGPAVRGGSSSRWSHHHQMLPYSQSLGTNHHRKLPEYNDAQAGAKRPRYEERPRYEADEEQAGTVTFSLISTAFFTAKIRRPTPAAVHTYFKLTPGATYDEKERRWKFPLGAHENLAGALSRQGVQVVPVPRQALAAATLAVGPEQGVGCVEGTAGGSKNTPGVKLCEKMVPECVRKNLAPFQMQGVEFVLKKEGRAMIADEMGLGKTIQAISCAAAYESEWPLLIICPSSARYHWEHELLKWLDEDSITKKEIVVVCKGKQDLNMGVTKVVIISYDLVNRMRVSLDLFNFGVVVCDECHYLKNQRAARTKAIVPLATKARRAILLSGTPALSRPSELFTQLNLLSAATWASFREFGKRYCSGKKFKGKKGRLGWDYSGASHIAELHALLRATVMVRRLKKNILKHLPPKQRALVEVAVEDDGARQALQEDLSLLATRDALLGRLAKAHGGSPNGGKAASLSQSTEAACDSGVSMVSSSAPQRTTTEVQKGKGNARQKKVAPGKGRVTKLSALPRVAVDSSTSATPNGEGSGDVKEPTEGARRDLSGMSKTALAQERRSLLMKLFADTGTAKIPAVIRHVSDVLADEMTGGKVLVFAHHRNVLDALEQGVLKTGRVEYIRIDGRTKPKDRQDLVDTFQSNPSVRVALLGLTAAGIGITLTAASRVVFAELYWTPAQLLQAEDRCHRIGQASVVKVQYLVAKGSLDDALWPLIQQKIKLLGEMVEGEGEANQMEVNTKDYSQTKELSSSSPTGASSISAGETAATDMEDAISTDIDGKGPAAEEVVRASFQELQASVAENAQELAVEDMRHELDDENRREFFEEEEEDGDEGMRGGNGSDGASSGYSDGGGGQGAGDNVYDIIDSEDGDSDDIEIGVAFSSEGSGSAQANTLAKTHTPGPQSLCWDGGINTSSLGLTAAVAAAKASAGVKEGTLPCSIPVVKTDSVGGTSVGSKVSPVEEVIDLLSGDEYDPANGSDGGKGSGSSDVRGDDPLGTVATRSEVVVVDDDSAEACVLSCANDEPKYSAATSNTNDPTSDGSREGTARGAVNTSVPLQAEDGAAVAIESGSSRAKTADEVRNITLRNSRSQKAGSCDQ